MAITITITIDETSAPGERRVSVSRTAPIAELREFATDDRSADLNARYAELLARHTELVRQMGDEIGDFPAANVDGFLSHFIITIEFNRGPLAGKTVSLAMPPAAQTVSRSAPFIYQGPAAKHKIKIPLPAGCTLGDTIAEEDFKQRPAEFFRHGAESVWMQILNLDSRMDTNVGPIRIILGETVKQEYPDLFEPSLGIAESLGQQGFPARLFFNPCAIVETPAGAFRAVHGVLSYGRTTAFPPVGTPVSIQTCIPLDDINDIRESQKNGTPLPAPGARIVALSHPMGAFAIS